MGVDGVVDHAEPVVTISEQGGTGTEFSTDTVGIHMEVAGGVHRGVEDAVLDHLDDYTSGSKMHGAGLAAGPDPEVLSGDIDAGLTHLRPGRSGGTDGEVDGPPGGLGGFGVDLPFPGDDGELLHLIGEADDFPALLDHVRLGGGVEAAAADLVVVDHDNVVHAGIHLDPGDVLQDHLVEIAVTVIEEDDAIRLGGGVAAKGENRGAGTA